MNQDEYKYIEESKTSIFKRIIIWIVVLLITAMMIAVVIFQPRFFTFLN